MKTSGHSDAEPQGPRLYSALLKIGDRAQLKDGRIGTIKWVGELGSTIVARHEAGIWIGLKLDDSDGGEHDGEFRGKRFFSCPPNFGIMVPISSVSRHKEPKWLAFESCERGKTVLPATVRMAFVSSYAEVLAREKARQARVQELAHNLLKHSTVGPKLKALPISSDQAPIRQTPEPQNPKLPPPESCLRRQKTLSVTWGSDDNAKVCPEHTSPPISPKSPETLETSAKFNLIEPVAKDAVVLTRDMLRQMHSDRLQKSIQPEHEPMPRIRQNSQERLSYRASDAEWPTIAESCQLKRRHEPPESNVPEWDSSPERSRSRWASSTGLLTTEPRARIPQARNLDEHKGAAVRIGDRVVIVEGFFGVVRWVGRLSSNYVDKNIFVGIHLDEPVVR